MEGNRIYPKRWLSCFKAGHRVASREFIDEELAKSLLKRVEDSQYTDLEAIQALDYLHKFNSEFHKNVLKKGDRNALHRSKKMRRDCYARENSRNRDVVSMRRDKLQSLEVSIKKGEENFLSDIHLLSSGVIENPENTIIEILDRKNTKG